MCAHQSEAGSRNVSVLMKDIWSTWENKQDLRNAVVKSGLRYLFAHARVLDLLMLHRYCPKNKTQDEFGQ